MTGTSIDALDAALVELRGSGLGLRVSVRATASWALGPLGDDLRRAASGQPAPAGFFASLSRRFGEFHAERLGAWLDALSGAPDLVCVHGQTVFHAPPDSWQLIDASPIVRRVGAPTVFDLRRADLSCGGQGAPITPIADWVLFRDDRSARAVVNLGGFCNITRLGAGGGPETVRGSDVCACNQVLDAIALRVAAANNRDDANHDDTDDKKLHGHGQGHELLDHFGSSFCFLGCSGPVLFGLRSAIAFALTIGS